MAQHRSGCHRVVRIDGRSVADTEPFQFTPSPDERPSAGERLVLFFLRHGEAISFWFAMATIALLVAVAAGAFVGAAL